MTSVSENVYNDKLHNKVNKQNNTYCSVIKMKPVDVKSSTYIDFTKENNEKDLKSKICDIVRIVKCKNKEVFVIKKV